ncbi:MAG: DUF4132 domain-containing protein [Planctomycetaceae bacterium]
MTDDDILGDLFAELPEELRDIARQLADEKPAGPNPERISIRAAQAGSVAANDRTRPWIEFLDARNATHLGDFLAEEFPVGMHVYRDTANRLIVISYLGEHSWADVTLKDQAEISWTWSNVPTTDGKQPPWARLTHQPDADLAALLELADESAVVSAEAQHTPQSFVETFTKSFQLSMMWRNAIIECDSIRQPPPIEIEHRVFEFAREFIRTRAFHESKGIRATTTGKALLAAGPADAIEILISAFRMQSCVIEMFRYDLLESLRVTLLKRDLPLQPTDLDCLAAFMLQLALDEEARGLLPPFLGAVERFQKNSALPESVIDRLWKIGNALSDAPYSNYSKERAGIRAILGDDKVSLPMRRGEAWVQAVATDLAKLPEDEQAAWVLLFNHCVAATKASYDKAWSNRATEILKDIGSESLHQHLFGWLPALKLPRLEPPNHYGWPPPLSIDEAHQDVLRGLAWCVSLTPCDHSPRLLAALAISAFLKIPRVGSRAVRVGNACVMALTSIGTQECVAQLALLKIKVKNGTALRYIDKQLQKTADRLNVSRDDLEEMSVPTYGMEEVGHRREPMGDFEAEVTVTGSGVTLVWRNADGKIQKSVPAAVKTSHADDVKELKADIKDAEKMLAAQRDRLEGLYLLNRSWPFEVWRSRYLDHPLVGVFARRLIWEFTTDGIRALGIHHEGTLRDLNDQPLSGIDSATVRLWHPLNDDVEPVVSWRQWLVDHQVCQPFKQAHREIYILTPAEITTETYSNRFAAHILRQSQYRALAQARSWNVNFLGAWDGGDCGIARRSLTAWNLRSEFWVNAAAELEQFQEVTHVVTDQVRFYRDDDRDSMLLIDVPPMVFSEIMRDVDLFVSVASVGNDPNWYDRGDEGRGYQEYWTSYAFGDLTASGKTRHDVLQGILPRLKIAGQCRLEDRFLVVEGKLRTYKIHLGSGNIRMEPNDQYLCIVPDQKSTKKDQTYLPFEGDTILSIILSKAFLLAQDDKIRDPTILQQLKL